MATRDTLNIKRGNEFESKPIPGIKQLAGEALMPLYELTEYHSQNQLKLAAKELQTLFDAVDVLRKMRYCKKYGKR